MTYHARAAHAAKAHLQPFAYDQGPLGPDEVEVAVTHCGICHTDVGMADNERGIATYPFVPGHEIAGTVAAIGATVDPGRLRVGQRVAFGAICGSCMRCAWCEGGRQHLCPDKVDTVMRGHQGGFATHVRAANWRFVYPVPDAIASEHAAPLMCAGTTVFAPLLRHNVRPVDRVAVVGIAGLGHLAVQFLAKWGCEVTAISRSHDHDAEARGFGAAHVIATRGTDELQRAVGSFDFILSTASGDLPWDDYLAALCPGGTLCVVGVPDTPVALAPLALLPAEKVVAGGIPGSLVETQQMLAFAARHGIRPAVELFPMAEADRALDHTRRGRARYRAVLVA
jgi:uncharacterized zinc-type alcohol dehydrogenase-like protein